MEVEGEHNEINPERVNGHDILDRNGRRLQWLVVIICVISWLLGFSAGIRFLHTKLLRWLVLGIGLPIPLLPILDPQRRSSIATVGYIYLTVLLGAMAVKISPLYPSSMGFLFAVSMICSELFAVFLFRTGITPCPLNSIFLLLSRAVLSGLWSTGERAGGVTRGHFILGFVFTILGFVFPLAHFAFEEVAAEGSLVLAAMSLSFLLMTTATVGMVGLIINGDFGHLRRPEDHLFRQDAQGYLTTNVVCPIAWQTFFLAFIGLVFLASSLFYEMYSER